MDIYHEVMTTDGLKKFAEPISLELGCGKKKRKSWYTGIDKSPWVSADITMNFANTPLPFPNNSIDQIYTAHTFEHLTGEELIFVMNECFRVLKWVPRNSNSKYPDRGKMWIHVPHMDCKLAWQDPTHKSYFNEESMKFFCGWYLIKHSLDYGISAIFYDASKSNNITIDDPEKPEYCKMIEFLLLKDYNNYDSKLQHFPFNIPKKMLETSEEEFEEIEDKFFMTTNYKTEHNNFFNNELKNVAKQAINKHLEEILRIKIDATNRYGVKFAPLGRQGIFSDITRKYERTRLHYKEGKLTSEGIKDTLRDGAVYYILALLHEEELEMKRLKGE